MKYLLLILLLCAGCQSTGKICLPEVPTWIDRGTVTTQQVYAYAINELKLIPAVSDSSFAIIDHEVFLEFIDWKRAARWALRDDGGAAYVLNAWDCETRANAVDLAYSRSIAIAGIEAKPLSAIISVHQVHAWGGVAAGGNHALLLKYTTEGLIVEESQSDSWCRFEDYPNKAQIYDISLRG